MIGTSLGRYKIIEQLGAGGMGEVYRALDPRLDRNVALKVLPAALAADPNRLERFRREAKAIAALTHPNIVMVHSVEEHAGTHFLTMELVEGRALDRLIPKEGMAPGPLLEIAVPLADAIAAAHECSIVHRDLKPTNIMVSAGNRVKVLDFGLAKLQRSPSEIEATAMATEVWMTQEGQVVGTVPYMSPEQVEGRAVDHRTDVFSLGVVLYEMATGGRPFAGETSAALMASILKDTPRLVAEINERLPRHLGRVVSRCLEKGVKERYQTALDVHNELRLLQREVEAERTSAGGDAVQIETCEGFGASSAAPKDTSGSDPSVRTSGPHVAPSFTGTPSLAGASSLQVAVMPFTERSGVPDLASLAEGISENVVRGLARFTYMNVVSSGASFALQEQALDTNALGERLGARYILDGSVRRAGATTRVSARLVDSSTGAHLWAENYDRDLTDTDPFAIQDDIAGRIVSTTCDLYGVLPRAMGEVMKAKPPETLTPYEAVLRTFTYWHTITPDEHLEVRTLLERAVQQDPRNADAWASLSLMYSEEYRHGFNTRPDPLGRALDAARRATSIDGVNHVGQHALAPGALLPQGIRRLPRCRRPGHRPQPLGRLHRCLHGRPDGVQRRLGSRRPAGPRRRRAQPPSRRLVRLRRGLQLLPPGRLGRGACLRPADQHAGLLLYACRACGHLRPRRPPR